MLGGVDVGEDGDEGDDAAEDPDPHDQGDHHVPAECWWPRLLLNTYRTQLITSVFLCSTSNQQWNQCGGNDYSKDNHDRIRQ